MRSCFGKAEPFLPQLACPKSHDGWDCLYISTAWEQKACWNWVRRPQKPGNWDQVDLYLWWGLRDAEVKLPEGEDVFLWVPPAWKWAGSWILQELEKETLSLGNANRKKSTTKKQSKTDLMRNMRNYLYFCSTSNPTRNQLDEHSQRPVYTL